MAGTCDCSVTCVFDPHLLKIKDDYRRLDRRNLLQIAAMKAAEMPGRE